MGDDRTSAGHFGRIPEWLLDAAISDRAKVLYAMLTRYEPDIRPSRRVLAKRLRCSPSAVNRALDELNAIGAIKREPRFTDRGDQTANRIYLLGDEPPSDPLVTADNGAPLSPVTTPLVRADKTPLSPVTSH